MRMGKRFGVAVDLCGGALVLAVALAALVVVWPAFASPALAIESTAVWEELGDIDGGNVVWSGVSGPEPLPVAGDVHRDIYHYDLGTGGLTNLTPDEDFSEYVRPAVGGGHVVFTDEVGGSVYLVDLADGSMETLWSGPGELTEGPYVSTAWVVWTRAEAGSSDMVLYDLTTGTQELIAHPEGSVLHGIEGERIVFTFGPEGPEDLYVYDVSSGEGRRIARPLGASFVGLTGDYAAYLTDGGYAVFEDLRGGEVSRVPLLVRPGWLTARQRAPVSAGGGTVAYVSPQESNPLLPPLLVYEPATRRTRGTGVFRPARVVSDGFDVAWQEEGRHSTTIGATAASAGAPYDYRWEFNDVGVSHPYLEAVTLLRARGVISGYEVEGGREFRPDAAVKRAQFAKMIVGALALPVREDMTSPFTDFGVPDPGDNFYPQQFVAAVYQMGIIKGTTPTTFSPWNDVSRAQVITMAVRAARALEPDLLERPPEGWGSAVGDFSAAHAENLRWAEYNGMLEGIQGYGLGWDPWTLMPRGEVAELLSALLWMGA